ncbi:hypothetical protein C0J52_12277 [Blattella germanica]|nr:hypothetical protein C0J52_12277 [Blattella germanica]
MADLRQCSREFLTDFISHYESFPCLWRVKSKEYSDRDKKGEAYERLVEKFKEIDVNASRETVVKKINSLRSVYRKELAKVNKSIRSGAGEDEIYKPSLWYFDLLHFLNDQETPRPSRNTMDESEESVNCDESSQLVEDDVQETVIDIGPSEAATTPATPASEASTSTSHSVNTSRKLTRNKRKAVGNDDGTTEVLQVIGKKLESLQADDAFQVFGKHVANKLREVPNSQNIIAQKLISDVLFEAELGTLTRNFRIVDMKSQRQDDFGSMNATNYWPQQNTPHQIRMQQNLSSQVGQYHSFSQQPQPMPHNYAPEQIPHTQEYETIGKIPAVSCIIPQQGEQDVQTRAHQAPAHSPVGTYLSSFQPN